MTNITTPRSVLSVGLNILRLSGNRRFHHLHVLSALFEQCMLQSFTEHCTRFTITQANFTQNVIFIFC
jgi:hypothetical protein